MFVRSALLVTVAGLVGAAPSPTRYKVDQRVESKIDLSAFGQGEQVQSQAFVWFFTASYSDSAAGTVMHVVLDSLQADLGMAPVPPGAIDSAKGTTFHAFMDASGKVQTLTASKSGLLTSQFEGFLKGFQPRLKRAAKLGDSWIDTLDVETKSAQVTSKTHTITNYSMGGVETWDGVQATKLEAAFSAAMTGTMETPAGSADMEGKSTGSSTFYLAKDGRYLGGKTTSAGDASISGAFAPTAIPVKNTTTITVNVIK
jgi:hypothetical protein